MGLTTMIGAGLGGLTALNAARNNSNGSSSSNSSSSDSSSSYSGDTAVTNMLYENLTNQLKQSVHDSKIGQVVPHMDTPAVQYGFGISQTCAKILLRSSAVPFPKLSQLESLSDLHNAYHEAYPQRLDIFCVLLALFPLLSLKMKERYTLNIYVGPAISCWQFSRYYTRRAAHLTLGHPVLLRGLRKILCENPVFIGVNEYAVQQNNRYIPRLHEIGCWSFERYRRLVVWCCIDAPSGDTQPWGASSHAVGNDRVVPDAGGNNAQYPAGMPRTNTIVHPLMSSQQFDAQHFGSGSAFNPAALGGIPGGSGEIPQPIGSQPTDESFHMVNMPMPSHASEWMPIADRGINMPQWMREFEARANQVAGRFSNPFGSGAEARGAETAANPNVNPRHRHPDYYELTVTKEALQRALKTAGFVYAVPALVVPAQFLFGLNCLAGRARVGPLTPGKKVWYPFEEMVEMLPSLSSPGKDPKEASAASRWLNQHSWLGLSVVVVGFGVLGVVFGGGVLGATKK
jgi:hypothetical protein